jgi:hypothetical protein
MSLFASVSLITTTRGIFPNICGILYSHTPRHAHVHTFFTFWTKCRKTISLPPVQQSPFLRAQSAQNPVHDDSSPHPLLLQQVRLLASATFQKTPTSCHPSAVRRRRHLLPLSSPHSYQTLFNIHFSIHGVARPRHPGRPRRRPPPGSGRAPPRPAPPRPARLRHHLLPAPVRAVSSVQRPLQPFGLVVT